MNALIGLADIWAAALWKASWQGGLAALIVWSLCRALPSMPARFQCWLWRLVVLKFAVALLWSAPIELPFLPAPELAAIEMMETTTPIWAEVESAPVVAQDASSWATPGLIAFAAWSLVVVCQAVWIVRACRAARRLKRGCRPSENRELLGQLAVAGKSFGFAAPPAVLETSGDGSPLLVGLLRPAIVIPATTLSRLDDRERAMVIGHELAHARRWDLVWGLIAAAVRAVFFFHPLAWLSERRLRATQEIAADELAAARQNHDAVGYASLLVSVVSKLGSGRVLPAMSVGAVGSQQSLKQRLFAMRFMKPLSRRAVAAYSLTLGLVTVLGVVPWAVVAAEPTAADKPSADKPRTEDKPRSNDKVPPAEGKTVSGKFVSYTDGVLKIKDETKETEWQVAGDTKTTSTIRDVEQEGVAGEALKRWEPGALISVKVTDGKVTSIHIGVKKAPTPDRVEKKPTADREKNGWGKFVSFKGGTLTLESNAGVLLAWSNLPENARIVKVDPDTGERKQVEGVAAAFNQVKAKTWVAVVDGGKTIYIGAKKGQVVGTFVSFKEGRLLMLGKDLGESFTKKYGNNLHFNKFRDDVPVYESIDGGEYKLIGTANKVLGSVKDGTVLTVHSEGDDNITLIQIGVPKKS